MSKTPKIEAHKVTCIVEHHDPDEQNPEGWTSVTQQSERVDDFGFQHGQPLAELTAGVGRIGHEPWLAHFHHYYTDFAPAVMKPVIVLDLSRYEAYADFQYARDAMITYYKLTEQSGEWIEERVWTPQPRYLRHWALYSPNHVVARRLNV